MKTFTFTLLVAASLLTLGENLHSQAPVAKSPAEQLKAIKAISTTVIEQQKQTLLKLEELEKQSEQIRFLAARS